MSSRPRCNKRGSTGKDAPNIRKPLENISVLQNALQPAARKHRKTCLAEPKPAKSLARTDIKVSIVTSQTVTLRISRPERDNVMVDGSDFDDQSSDSSPRQPVWFCHIPQKHRQVMMSMLENTGIAISQEEREVIIRDCCRTLKIRGHAEEFLEWMTTHEHLSSLATRLGQTAVCPVSSADVVSNVGYLYADEIHETLLSQEDKFAVCFNYMETVQQDITHNMRSILVDWLVEVGEEYKLSNQTLFLAVNYVDRLLGLQSISRSKLQLLGVTSMLVAAKYEEIYPPTVDEFVYISDNTYSRQDVLTMESILLTSLQFNLSAPTVWEFVRSFCSSGGVPRTGDRPRFLAHFLSELFLMFPCSLKYRASVVAAAAIFLGLFTLHLPPWPSGLLQLAGNNQDLLTMCVQELHAAHKKVILESHSLKAIREKYQDAKWLRVALVPSRSLDT